MKKLVIPVLLVLLLVIPVLAGCGGEPGGEILNKSIEKMEKVNTLTMKIDVTSEEGGETIRENFEAVVTRSDGNPEEFDMMLVTDSPGTEDKIYVVDGYRYMKIEGEWFKSPVSGDSIMGLGQFEQLKDMSDAMVVTSEDDNSWTLSFDLSSEFLEDALMEETEGLETMGPEFDEMIQSFVESTKITGELKIAKSTYYLEKMNTAMSASIEGLGSFALEAIAEYSDYDKDLKVELPADAKSARDLPEDMEMPELPFSDPISF